MGGWVGIRWDGFTLRTSRLGPRRERRMEENIVVGWRENGQVVGAWIEFVEWWTYRRREESRVDDLQRSRSFGRLPNWEDGSNLGTWPLSRMQIDKSGSLLTIYSVRCYKKPIVAIAWVHQQPTGELCTGAPVSNGEQRRDDPSAVAHILHLATTGGRRLNMTKETLMLQRARPDPC